MDPFAGHVTGHIIDLVIILDYDADAVLAGMHKTHRKNIRRGNRDGLVAYHDRSLDGLLQLRRLQEASEDRAESGERGFNISDARYFWKIHSCV